MADPDMTTKTEALAAEVLTLSRDALLVHLRFLDAALSRLTLRSAQGTLATDGRMLFYDPRHILRCYQAEQSLVTRDYLHVLLHCVFRHICPPADVKPELWDLACDIAAEYAVSELGLAAAASSREQRQNKVYAALLQRGGLMTAEKIYRHYLSQQLSDEDCAALRALFLADDHRLWYAAGERTDIDGTWRAVAQRMQVDMDTFARRQGSKAGALMLNLREVNRQVSDFTGFLRKFAVRSDGLKPSPDEFDYGLYTYGMQLYGGKVPLIEPVEYRDAQRVRDFVVALETTPNFPAGLAAAFLQRTWGVLHSTESFRSQIRLHILLRGVKGWKHAVITNQEELDSYLSALFMPEESGRDFRPLFLQVDEMRRQRCFENLRGLLCFTDGYGPFPANMPAYPAAFVFVNDDYSIPAVPPWAIRQVLQRDEIGEVEPKP